MNLILLFIGLALLIFGAEIIIRGSISLGKKLKVSLFAIGVVIVAGGTSLPELASSINAVITNHADLAVGAVIGSNIANLILVMAATSFLIPISNINQNQINQAWINIGLAIILIFMSYFILPFNYLFGILSICLLFIIMLMQVKQGSLDVSEVQEKSDYSLFISIIFIVGGIILLIYGSDLFVESAINISNQLNIPEAIIGISLVAFGTSLPELVVGILSAIRRKVDFALGNVLGSNIYNVLGVLGVSSFFGNFSIPRVIGSVDLLFMLFVTVMILGFMIFLKRIGRTYGSIGLFFYVGYIVYVFN
ncbi:MAG: calcium/sodium antiporter [Pelagibacteraceae bacterium]|nr:calcium/sodium antiporter [Pelagibacteraceae bacterium]MBT3902363.1 calcium/sodium antiporter [Pelagibacteraceae bacterium]MBT4645735.1 calcium/sodium antiporter [Pelagibacteraceae bacterium]MBT4950241.1 calcium/sodium antiporter [Pelagibacteraceae bacterium]MBT5214947.1 calcium/sodium antiporter [Pelagibacteraceae bacterium]